MIRASAITLDFGDVSVIVAAKDGDTLTRAFHYFCVTAPPDPAKCEEIEIRKSTRLMPAVRDSKGRYSPKTGFMSPIESH